MFSTFVRRRLLAATALLATGAVTVALSGCSSGSPSGSSSPAATVTVPGASASGNSYMNQLYKEALSKGKTKVVIYGPSPSTDTALYAAFQSRFPGITVVPQNQPDSESLSKLQAESTSGNHVADMYTSGGPPTAQVTGTPGVCEAIDIKTAPASELSYADSAKLALNFNYRYFSIVYNTDKVSAADAPKSWDDLLNPKWKNQIEIGDPTVISGERFILADLLLPENSAKWGEPYLTKLAAQNITIASSSPNVATDVASGRFEIGLAVDSGYYESTKEKGGHIAIVFPMTDGGLFFATGAVCLVKNSPDQAATQLYLNWLFTPDGEKALAADQAYSILPDAPAPPGAPSFADVKKLPDPPNNLAELSSEFAIIDKLFKKS